MNPQNIRTMAVAAVVIVACLLYSWVQYDGPEAEGPTLEDADGTWTTLYTYYTDGMSMDGVPGEFSLTYLDGTVVMEAEGLSLEFVEVSDREAVWTGGYDTQIYLEGDILYLVSLGAGSGMGYMAMSRDGGVTLPSDAVDLTGLESAVVVITSDRDGAVGASYEGTLRVTSDSFHVARGTVSVGSSVLSFAGFVKTDGGRTVIAGVCDSDAGSALFGCVFEDGEVMFSTTACGDTLYAGGSPGASVESGDGPVTVDGIAMDLEVDSGLVAVSPGGIVLMGAVMWTLDGEIAVLSLGVVIVGEGGSYSVVAGSAMG